MKWRAIVVAGLIAWSVGCVRKGLHPQNVLRYPLESDPPTLDTAVVSEHVSFEVLFCLVEGLTRLDIDMKIIPGLAEKWEISADGTVYTFHLRDAKWSDGVPIKAQDFVTSWRRLVDPKRASQYAYFLFDVENASEINAGKVKDPTLLGVKALNDKTLEVHLKFAASYFLNVLSSILTAPQRQDIVDANPTNFTEPQHFRSSGPFRLTEWAHDSRLTLEPNPYYYGKKSTLGKLQFLVVKEDSTAFNMYERGELDVALRIPALDLDRVSKRPDYRSVPALRGYYYGFNVAVKPFDNLLVRKAFAHAVDRKELVAVLKGGRLPTASWVPKGMFGYEPDIGLEYNPELAKQLLAKAGYPGGKGFPAVTMMYDSLELNKLVAEKLQYDWKTVLGIPQLELATKEWKVFIDTLNTNTPQLWRMGWGADYPDPHNFLDLFTSVSGNNNTHWKSPVYDGYVLAGAKTLDLGVRKEIYRKAQKLLLEDDTVIVPLFQQTTEMMVKPYVKNFVIDAIEDPRMEEVSINSEYDLRGQPAP